MEEKKEKKIIIKIDEWDFKRIVGRWGGYVYLTVDDEGLTDFSLNKDEVYRLCLALDREKEIWEDPKRYRFFSGDEEDLHNFLARQLDAKKENIEIKIEGGIRNEN